MAIRWLHELSPAELSGKTVLLRADFNVPIVNGRVRDAFRLHKAFPTLELLAEAGVRTVVVSHIENDDESPTLGPVATHLKEHFDVHLFSGPLSEVVREVNAMSAGGFLLLENIRRFPGEKKNDPDLAQQLAACGNLYVNDAFSVSHRAHASVVGVPWLLEHVGGLLFEEEYTELSHVRHPERPCVVALGGAKSETKIPVLRALAPTTDRLFEFGASANTFYKARGYEIGISPFEESQVENAAALMKEFAIEIPEDCIVRGVDGQVTTKRAEEVRVGEKIIDAGPAAVTKCATAIECAKMILWNGPLGIYEQGFTTGTDALAHAISKSSAYSVVGGGDTIAALPKDVTGKFSFISSGGGAMLEFLAQGTLPGIEALER